MQMVNLGTTKMYMFSVCLFVGLVWLFVFSCFCLLICFCFLGRVGIYKEFSGGRRVGFRLIYIYF